MKKAIEAKRTLTRSNVTAYGEKGATVVASVGWWHPGEGSKQRPSFSVTLWARSKNGRDLGGGAAHDEFARLWPELAYLVPWHLCDDDGSPMHYTANACHWLEYAAGLSEFKRESYGPSSSPEKAIDAFKGTVAFGKVAGDTLPDFGHLCAEGATLADFAIGGPVWDRRYAAFDKGEDASPRAKLARLALEAEDEARNVARDDDTRALMRRFAEAMTQTERDAYRAHRALCAEEDATKAALLKRREELRRIVREWCAARAPALFAAMQAEAHAFIAPPQVPGLPYYTETAAP